MENEMANLSSDSPFGPTSENNSLPTRIRAEAEQYHEGLRDVLPDDDAWWAGGYAPPGRRGAAEGATGARNRGDEKS
jgi:hypothetical protein